MSLDILGERQCCVLAPLNGSVGSLGDLIGSHAGRPYSNIAEDSLPLPSSVKYRQEEVCPENVPGVVAVNCILGAGTFAKVYSCSMSDANGDIGTYAVKIPQNTDVVAEAKHQMILNHPNLVKLFQVIDEPPVLVLEVCVGGTLLHALQSTAVNAIGLRARVAAAIGIADAIAYVHEQGYIHRDIKTGNVFLSEALSGNTMSQLKLGDFGFCKRVASTMTRCKGTLRYMAPEVMLSNVYGNPADVYSFGMLLWELLTGEVSFIEFPARAEMRLIPHVVRGGRPDLSMLEDDPSCAPVANVVAAAWGAVPEERPSAAVLVRDLELLIPYVPDHIGAHGTGQ